MSTTPDLDKLLSLKTFDDLNRLFNRKNEYLLQIESGEKGKGYYVSRREKVKENITVIKAELENIAIISKPGKQQSQSSNSETEEPLLPAIKAVRNALFEMQKSYAEAREFIAGVNSNITKLMQAFSGWKAFRKRKEKELIDLKINVVTETVRLRIYMESAKKGFFERAGSKEQSLKNISAFLDKLKGLNFHELNNEQVKSLKASFKEATATGFIPLSSNDKVKKGMGTEINEKLDYLLKAGAKFSEKSKTCWSECEAHEKSLVEDNYLKKYEESIKMVSFEEDYRLETISILQKLEEAEKTLLEVSSEKSKGDLYTIKVNKIPPQIGWLKAAYGLSTWTYENIGAQISQNKVVDKLFPLSATVNLAGIKTPEVKADLDIPVATLYGLADIGFALSASVEAGLSLKGTLELYNFLKPSESDYVGGKITAEASASAALSGGVFAKLVQTVRVSGDIVLEAEAAITAESGPKLSKANIDNITLFKISSSAGISFMLKGYLQLRIALTPVISMVLETLGTAKPALTITTTVLEMFKAERKATIDFEMPLKKKPHDLPRDSFNLSSGAWTLEFIGKDLLDSILKDQFGGLDEWRKVSDKVKISKEELESIKREFGTLEGKTA